jgi:hypothetical protein
MANVKPMFISKYYEIWQLIIIYTYLHKHSLYFEGTPWVQMALFCYTKIVNGINAIIYPFSYIYI